MAKFWLGLQNDYDIEEEKSSLFEMLNRIRKMRDDKKNAPSQPA